MALSPTSTPTRPADLPCLEQAIDAFEEAWQQAGESRTAPNLHDFLPAPPADCRDLLVELIAVDLQYHWHRPATGSDVRPLLEAYLARYPELAPDGAPPLALIAEEYRARRRRGYHPSHAEYAQRFPRYAGELPALLQRTDADLTAEQGPALLPLDNAPTHPSAHLTAGPWSRAAGYEILEEIGRGGMGVVYKARQTRLQRLVALKKIHGGADTQPETLERFRREAEAVARLDHPNIVQIHELAEQDGQLYLALEYVSGGSLAARLTGPLPPRAAAELLATLARAVEHAHGRGIVHRDLKPANILLAVSAGATSSTGPTPLNECVPKISDFGLAKDLTRELGQTQTGAIVGTPSYMAPEQAAGLVHQIGPTADVYALGAILYECLTGRPAFQGTTLLETLEQVRTQEPVPPRRLQPRVPRDLETICLKCLHKEPGKRYSSAAVLAEDLQRFLDGTAIRARPVPRWERAWKWTRRRPAVAGLLVLAVLSVAALVGGLWLHTARLSAAVQRAEDGEGRALAQQQRAEKGEAQALAHQQRADLNYQQARQAISQMLARLDRFNAPGVPQVETLRRGLRKDILAFYEGIAHVEEDAGPGRRLEVAQAYMLMAGVQEPQEGYASLKHARSLLEKIVAEEPDHRGFQSELARCFTLLSHSAAILGRADECLAFRQKALTVLEELDRAYPDNADVQYALAVCHTNLGCCYEDSNWSRAEHHWQQAVRILEEVTHRHPEPDGYQQQLAISYTNLALLYCNTRRMEKAFPLYARAEARLSSLVQRHPEERVWAFTLVQTLHLWGASLVWADQGEKALPILTRAVTMTDAFIREDPTSAGNREMLLRCLTARMHCDTLLNRREEGEADWKRCLELAAALGSWNDPCEGTRGNAKLGAHARAATQADWLLKQKGITPDNRYALACAYALAAAAASRDSQLAAAQQKTTAEGYAAAAMALLDPLAKQGHFKTPQSRTQLRKSEADLETLRSREDFKKVLSRLPAD